MRASGSAPASQGGRGTVRYEYTGEHYGGMRIHIEKRPPLEGDTSTGGTLAILGVMRTGHSRGVSVLEIILVVAVLGILLAVGFPRLVTTVARVYANDGKAPVGPARY